MRWINGTVYSFYTLANNTIHEQAPSGCCSVAPRRRMRTDASHQSPSTIRRLAKPLRRAMPAVVNNAGHPTDEHRRGMHDDGKSRLDRVGRDIVTTGAGVSVRFHSIPFDLRTSPTAVLAC